MKTQDYLNCVRVIEPFEIGSFDFKEGQLLEVTRDYQSLGEIGVKVHLRENSFLFIPMEDLPKGKWLFTHSTTFSRNE